jgi:hypothetical protein
MYIIIKYISICIICIKYKFLIILTFQKFYSKKYIVLLLLRMYKSQYEIIINIFLIGMGLNLHEAVFTRFLSLPYFCVHIDGPA